MDDREGDGRSPDLDGPADGAALVRRFLASPGRHADDARVIARDLCEQVAGLGGVRCAVVWLDAVGSVAVDPDAADPPAVDEDAVAEVRRTRASLLLATPDRAWVPIERDGAVAAVVRVDRVDEARPPLGEPDVRVVEALAAGAALRVELLDVRRAGRREAERSAIVASFFASVVSAPDPTTILASLAEHVIRAIRGGVVVYRVAEDGEHLDVVAAEPPDSLVARLARPVDRRRLRVGEAISGRVAQTGEPYFRSRFTDAELEAYRAGLPPDLAAIVGDSGPPAAIAVPLRTGGEVAAVLFASREPSDPEPFEEPDFRFVDSLATRAAAALEAVATRHAVDREAERERIRGEVLEAAAHAGDEEQAVLDALVRSVARLGGYASVTEVAEDGRTYRLRAWHAHDDAIRERLAGVLETDPIQADAEGPIAVLLRTSQPLFVPRMVPADAEGRRPSAREVVRAITRGLVLVPLWEHGRIIGAVGVGHVDPSFPGYERRDLAFLESLASTVSLVIDNARTRRNRDAVAAEHQQTAGALAAILDASPVAIIAVDRDDRVTFWSKGAERLYGWSAEEVVGRPPPHFGQGQREGSLRDEWRRVDEGEASLRIETTRQRRSGERIDVNVHLVPLRDADGAIVGLLTVQEDVTERRRLESDLIQAQKMETVGRLAGGVAHDFNNILTAIIGYAFTARDDATEPSVVHALGVIQRSAERAAALTQQLLAFSRRQMLRPVVVEVNEVVTEVEPMLRRLIGEHIELVIERAPEAGAALVDRTQLGQVILNLAVNGRDAMPDGGRLTISTGVARFDVANPHANLAPGDYVLLSVADTGHGMDDETRAHIFEPFFTTKGVGEGTGLGLATVYGIVRQSDGHIWVYSEPGSGAVFRIYLPRVAGSELPGVEVEAPADGTGEVVLLVEDDELLRGLARTVLRERGFTVVEASRPDEALEIARERPVDVLVSDVVMPGMSGVELARRLREHRRGLPVLLMSGYAEDAVGATTAGSGFLAKPFTPNALVRAVRLLLEPPPPSRDEGA